MIHLTLVVRKDCQKLTHWWVIILHCSTRILNYFAGMISKVTTV